LEETTAEEGLPPRGVLTGPRRRSDRGTRFDRPVEAVEPGLPEHTLGFIKHWFSFLKISFLNIITRCLLSQSVSLRILLPWYMIYHKFIHTRYNV
jgi:hypothetical protein